MEEVKLLYLRGQYKQCSARCKQILNSISELHQVHALYSIYLCFFTASSLELTARSLNNNSSNKLPLFQESLAFYQKAQSLISSAAYTNNTVPTLKQHKSNSSISSSIRSSVDSIFSQASISSVASSILDSPTYSSPTNLENESTIAKPQPLRPKKKVSFSLDLSNLPPVQATIREESNSTDILSMFPSPPTLSALSPTIIPPTLSLSTTLTRSPPPMRHSTHPPQTQNNHKYQNATSSSSTYAHLLSLSISRYTTHLSALQTQLSTHITSLHAQIHTLSTIRRARRSNLPDLFISPQTTTSTPKTPAVPEQLGKIDEAKEDQRRSEIYDRVARLREQGWVRKRFDGDRYRVLCERVIGELEGEDARRGGMF
ncbi:hypothetical protein B0J14DRAFT_477974 [Halenospora varia]|nr:hypothetical protein B0J14DRAFT_477974 [Halenospora varia]